ncbi:LuxR family transcriptional regulator [Chryseobacterium sp. Leaf404]|uniref:LuxR C-terminal-related transcriptional regulator n=1 Tax=unclassified Chryseobacterium TaxID=2593645 RepID=UPI0006F47BA3|nr:MULTISPECIES: LuxR C-terminal-related transcriptional regulator [unclassified Chryseobacterium]KQT16419.1 LuxR family transcriptional regulator [Chryseobacterium sp. Leaf404]
MENPEDKHLLSEIWERFAVPNQTKAPEKPFIEKIIGEMFSIGNFYYYVINFADSTISHHHKNILKIHGLSELPLHLSEILSLIHPDDISFVLKAENIVVDKIKQIGVEHQLLLKPSYCFRMKTKKGKYELFHHQAIHTLMDESNRLYQAINIHTNIQHITPQNPYTVLITGISPRKDFHQFTVQPVEDKDALNIPKLTSRETEILVLIAKGYSGAEISKMLILSEHTIRTHRKNILRKTESRNCKELIKKAFEWGMI